MNLQFMNSQKCACAQRSDKERQEEEESTEELKRFMMQEMTRGFSLLEETLLAQNPNVVQYMKVAADIQNAIHGIDDEGKEELLLRHCWTIYSKRVDRTESSKD